jgi:hypothetical protein
VIGTCKLCHGLIVAPPVLALGPERIKLELLALSAAMRDHVYEQHREQLQTFIGMLETLALYFATLFADLPAEAEPAQRDFLEATLKQVRDARLVIEQGHALTLT